MLVGIGDAELSALKANKESKRLELEARGQGREEITKAQEKAEQSIKQLENKLRRYKDELAQRRG